MSDVRIGDMSWTYDVVTDEPEPPYAPYPAPQVVYPVSSPAGLQSFRPWCGGRR